MEGRPETRRWKGCADYGPPAAAKPHGQSPLLNRDVFSCICELAKSNRPAPHISDIVLIRCDKFGRVLIMQRKLLAGGLPSSFETAPRSAESFIHSGGSRC
jgi:hypothetical protein